MLRKRSCGRFYPITSRIIYGYSWITTFNQYVLFAKEILIGSLEQTNKIISPANSKRELNIHRKKFYLQGKKSNRSKEYWKSLEICTSFVRSLIEPASFLIQDLFRDESYSKELCSRGVREDSLISNSFQRTGGARLDDDWTAGRSTFRQMKTSSLRGGRGEVSECSKRRRGRDARLRNAFTVARHLEKRPRTDEF